nr:50S ribosomal protein L6 [Desulfobacterales bacterium]
MSRVGKKPIPIPDNVDIVYDGNQILVKGIKGELSRTLDPCVRLNIKDKNIYVEPTDNTRRSRAIQGLTRTLIGNMITGVVRGFERVLEINGVGYRVDVKSDVLTFSLGYSHPIVYKLPKGISVTLEKQNRIILSGIDKELLGLTAAHIRSFRIPEPYKGKGIKYAEEEIHRKVGKSGIK